MKNHKILNQAIKTLIALIMLAAASALCFVLFIFIQAQAEKINAREEMRRQARAAIIRCVEEKFNARHVFFRTFENSRGERIAVGDFGECGERFGIKPGGDRKEGERE